MMDESYRSPPFELEGYWAYKVKYSDGSWATVLQHREAAESALGRTLPGEVVHHKNQDKKDNRPENLEVLTQSSHAKGHAVGRFVEMLSFICPECGKRAERQARFVRHNRLQGKAGPFCGKSCAGKFSARKQQ